jgi:hypothetical protein
MKYPIFFAVMFALGFNLLYGQDGNKLNVPSPVVSAVKEHLDSNIGGMSIEDEIALIKKSLQKQRTLRKKIRSKENDENDKDNFIRLLEVQRLSYFRLSAHFFSAQ